MKTAKALLVHPPIASLPWDDRRGTASMLMFISTEAMLFVSLFFGYFYLGAHQDKWPMDEPPKMLLATILLVILVASSGVMFAAEQASKAGRSGVARALLGLVIVMGVVFMVIQTFEYKDHLQHLRPTTDAYGSMFYTITSLHALHVIVGLGMLCYVFVLPDLEGKIRPPHRPLHNAGLYWHFVDTVWVFVVLLLYYLPNVSG